MSYIFGLICAAMAIIVAAGGARSSRPSTLWMFGLALAASTLVFYTVFGDPGLKWIRTLDCFEVALASLLLMLAIATTKRLHQRPFLLVVPAVPLSAVLALSLTDAVGITYSTDSSLNAVMMSVAKAS